MPEMKTLNGYEVVDAKAREGIDNLKEEIKDIPKPDLSSYATKTYVNEQIEENKPTKVSALENDAGYITKADVPSTDKFLTRVDNTDQYMWYATTSNATQVIENHVAIEKTDTALDTAITGRVLNKNTIAVRDGLQLRVPETPINAAHATSKAYVDKKIAEIPTTDLSEYAKKSDIPDTSKFITKIPDEYVTDTELEAKGYLTEHQSLTEYAKKAEIPTEVSQLTNDAGYLSTIPAEYITESELDAKGYLTEHQSLNDYAQKTYVDEAVAHIDLQEYAKKTDIPDTSKFLTEVPAEYITDTELNTSLEPYATKTYVDEKAGPSEQEVYYLNCASIPEASSFTEATKVTDESIQKIIDKLAENSVVLSYAVPVTVYARNLKQGPSWYVSTNILRAFTAPEGENVFLLVPVQDNPQQRWPVVSRINLKKSADGYYAYQNVVSSLLPYTIAIEEGQPYGAGSKEAVALANLFEDLIVYKNIPASPYFANRTITIGETGRLSPNDARQYIPTAAQAYFSDSDTGILILSGADEGTGYPRSWSITITVDRNAKSVNVGYLQTVELPELTHVEWKEASSLSDDALSYARAVYIWANYSPLATPIWCFIKCPSNGTIADMGFTSFPIVSKVTSTYPGMTITWDGYQFSFDSSWDFDSIKVYYSNI